MAKILVTGGAGYIGSHNVKELIKSGFEVVVLDSMENGFKQALPENVTLEVCDLADIDKVRAIFSKYDILAVIDFAAYLKVGESMEEPEKYLKNNVLNFINLLDVMVKKRVKYIIKSSTAATYGNPRDENDIPWKEEYTRIYQPEISSLLSGNWNGEDLVGEDFFQKFITEYKSRMNDRPELLPNESDEKTLRIPLSVYGLSKLLDEMILKKYNETHQVKAMALRYFNVCGANPDGDIGDAKPNPSNLMTLCIYQAMGKIPELSVFGRDYDTPDGTGVRDYIHPSDLATGHVAALNQLMKNNQSDVFNLGTGNGSSVLEVIAAVEKASSKKVNAVDKPRRSGDPAISIADPGKANKKLTWKAKFNLNDMAESAWRWHNKFPNGYK